jgi:hypothetical protein
LSVKDGYAEVTIPIVKGWAVAMLDVHLLLTVATIASLALIFLTQEAQRAQTWLKYNFLYDLIINSTLVEYGLI